MHFKTDENLHPKAADLLRQNGHDALTVYDQGLRGHGRKRRLQEVHQSLANPPGSRSVQLDLRFLRELGLVATSGRGANARWWLHLVPNDHGDELSAKHVAAFNEEDDGVADVDPKGVIFHSPDCLVMDHPGLPGNALSGAGAKTDATQSGKVEAPDEP
ncbi:MAG TPA: DUF5615 family PIN-like protein [Pirellulales bacterium]|nr:DUF5615 family PIN-like protein [Pirellulales bacterium]